MMENLLSIVKTSFFDDCAACLELSFAHRCGHGAMEAL
ncbi:hypothetical protein RIEGSTA812A_PEG_786 [invertebrate metagenome]|uniref:Uncharacterized protein n=1 Tax=invertebrate metagenome TaxID=1711999 RepID=A0A484H914_9ZZZZ